MTETVTLTVPSHPKFLYVVRSAVYPVVIESGFPKPVARKIVLALDEACSNIIKYAYEGDTAKSITVSISLDEDRLAVRLIDTGKKPDVEKIAPRQLEDVRPGGLGTHFMATVFDSVDYDTSGESGTVLTLVKNKR